MLWRLLQDPLSAPLKVVGESRSLVAKRTSASFSVPDAPHVMVGSVPILLPKIVVKSEVLDVDSIPSSNASDVPVQIEPDMGVLDNVVPVVVDRAPIVAERPKIKVI